MEESTTGQNVQTRSEDTPVNTLPTLVILSPRFESNSHTLPWYHPPVRHLAFRYILGTPLSVPKVRLEVVLLDLQDEESLKDTKSRLYRTCFSLLETVFRFAKGKMSGYKKRVVHDTLVPKEEYQDLYLLMRDRFKGIADTWHEATDASKHVFEDISIATFLMLLWKYTYPALEKSPSSRTAGDPWRLWGRPPSGFLDFGCGNGLLVHILLSCGYDGLGVDLRGRKSWPYYPQSTQDRLHVYAFDPLQDGPWLHQGTIDRSAEVITVGSDNALQDASQTPAFPRAEIETLLFPRTSSVGRFIIGNHADELQPWVPVIAHLTKAEYLSIPCCAWEFDERFQMKKRLRKSSEAGGHIDESKLEQAESTHRDLPVPSNLEELEVKLKHGESDGQLSLYAAYVLWLASLSVECGYVVESEALRIPSTRNRAIIGRKRTMAEDDLKAQLALHQHVVGIVDGVRRRGIFRSRIPEGKAGLSASEIVMMQEDEEGGEDHDGEDISAPIVRLDGREKEQPDRIFHLKELGQVPPIAMGVFRPTDMAWGNNAAGAGRGGRPAVPRKSKLSS